LGEPICTTQAAAIFIISAHFSESLLKKFISHNLKEHETEVSEHFGKTIA
jgi:hypothetical protein